MALSAPRAQTTRLGESTVPPLLAVKVAASTIIYAGAMVMLDAGYGKPAAEAVGKVVLGRAEETVDNSSGSAGDKTINVRRGVFKWDNSSSGDLIAQAQVASVCYAVDDHTVAKTSNSGARSVAGIVISIETDGVYVQQGLLSQADVDASLAEAVANVPALTGTLTGTVNGSLVNVAATAASTAGGSAPTAAQVDTGIATAVASIVSGVNEQNKELLTKVNAIIAAAVAAGWMAAP